MQYTQIIDISLPLTGKTIVYPGNPKIEISEIKSEASKSIISKIVSASHNGTHIDAPYHFEEDGIKIDQIPLDCLIGSATVFDIKNKEKIYREVNKAVPMGLGEISKPGEITPEGKKQYEKLVEKFEQAPYDKKVLNFLKSGKAERHLGSLGKGNHFISLNKDEKDFAWIVVHSGSRGVGHWAAQLYMKKSAMLEGGDNVRGNLLLKGGGSVGGTLVPLKFEETYPIKTDSETGKEYLNLLDFGLEFALLNRMEIIRKIIADNCRYHRPEFKPPVISKLD